VCVDLAPPMLALAPAPKLAATAERLPFATGCADVVTVSSGLHWFDQRRFFAEARRVLAPGGALVLYEHGFLGVVDDDRFQSWSRDVYRARYPTPPRGGYAGTVEPDGFVRTSRDEFVEPIELGHDALVDYFLSQSNTIGPVERGEESFDDARAWLDAETRVFFADEHVRAFSFWGAIEVWSSTSGS
jgi:SAM-dependent methyltransferase